MHVNNLCVQIRWNVGRRFMIPATSVVRGVVNGAGPANIDEWMTHSMDSAPEDFVKFIGQALPYMCCATETLDLVANATRCH